MVWCSHHLKNFPQFVVIHTIKGFGIVNEAETDVFFWNSLAFSMIQWLLAIRSLDVQAGFRKGRGTRDQITAWKEGRSRSVVSDSLQPHGL